MIVSNQIQVIKTISLHSKAYSFISRGEGVGERKERKLTEYEYDKSHEVTQNEIESLEEENIVLKDWERFDYWSVTGK